MPTFLERIVAKAKNSPKRIVFPEGLDERILSAMPIILEEGTAEPILLGDPEKIRQSADELGLSLKWDRVKIYDPATDPLVESFAKKYHACRHGKISETEALETVRTDVNTFGSLLVAEDFADGMVSGALHSTAQTIRPALYTIGTKEKFHKVSGFFFMVMADRLLLFADCAVIIEPNSHELADIAIDTAETALKFGIEPRIAMLSFSTNGSATHPNVDKVREATKMVQELRPDLLIEGEMQVDAALVPDVCERKFPGARSCGDFNILIFPSLEAGNIAYKLVQRLAGAEAIGPILQGFKKPINDLSRGCDVDDIVNVTAFTVVEAQGIEKILD